MSENDDTSREIKKKINRKRAKTRYSLFGETPVTALIRVSRRAMTHGSPKSLSHHRTFTPAAEFVFLSEFTTQKNRAQFRINVRRVAWSFLRAFAAVAWLRGWKVNVGRRAPLRSTD